MRLRALRWVDTRRRRSSSTDFSALLPPGSLAAEIESQIRASAVTRRDGCLKRKAISSGAAICLSADKQSDCDLSPIICVQTLNPVGIERMGERASPRAS